MFFLPIIQTLLKHIEDDDRVHLNAFNDEGDAPIHAIVRRKRKKRADLLLKLLAYGSSGVDINMLSMSGETALHIAVMVCTCTLTVCSSHIHIYY